HVTDQAGVLDQHEPPPRCLRLNRNGIPYPGTLSIPSNAAGPEGSFVEPASPGRASGWFVEQRKRQVRRVLRCHGGPESARDLERLVSDACVGLLHALDEERIPARFERGPCRLGERSGCPGQTSGGVPRFHACCMLGRGREELAAEL